MHEGEAGHARLLPPSISRTFNDKTPTTRNLAPVAATNGRWLRSGPRHVVVPLGLNNRAPLAHTFMLAPTKTAVKWGSPISSRHARHGTSGLQAAEGPFCLSACLPVCLSACLPVSAALAARPRGGGTKDGTGNLHGGLSTRWGTTSPSDAAYVFGWRGTDNGPKCA